jgi:hypothetical protein
LVDQNLRAGRVLKIESILIGRGLIGTAPGSPRGSLELALKAN